MCDDKVDANVHFEKDVEDVAGLSWLSCLFWGRRCCRRFSKGVLAWSELKSLSHREVLAYGTDLKLLRARRLLGGPRRWMRKGEDTDHTQFTKETGCALFEEGLGVVGPCVSKAVANARDGPQIAGVQRIFPVSQCHQRLGCGVAMAGGIGDRSLLWVRRNGRRAGDPGSGNEADWAVETLDCRVCECEDVNFNFASFFLFCTSFLHKRFSQQCQVAKMRGNRPGRALSHRPAQ